MNYGDITFTSKKLLVKRNYLFRMDIVEEI